MKILLTGIAGFIGFHVAEKLLLRGDSVIGIDNLNDYYAVSLKEDRLKCLEKYENLKFRRLDVSDKYKMTELFQEEKPDSVIHLAAQAGVRYSIDNPHSYIDSNISGMLNILEGCRHHPVSHLVYASSSSVYGANSRMPFSEHHGANHPVSLYGATKKSNEMMAHSYSSMFDIPVTGLRFFTVYGPWGRPDMAYFKFASRIYHGQPIQVFNFGKHQRDFTYVDDIVEGVVRILQNPPTNDADWDSDSADPASSHAPYKVYNIGNNKPVELGYFIELIEKYIGKSAVIEYLPMQAGDVLATYADIDDLIGDIGYSPGTSIEQGLEKFIKWYQSYYEDN